MKGDLLFTFLENFPSNFRARGTEGTPSGHLGARLVFGLSSAQDVSYEHMSVQVRGHGQTALSWLLILMLELAQRKGYVDLRQGPSPGKGKSQYGTPDKVGRPFHEHSSCTGHEHDGTCSLWKCRKRAPGIAVDQRYGHWRHFKVALRRLTARRVLHAASLCYAWSFLRSTAVDRARKKGTNDALCPMTARSMARKTCGISPTHNQPRLLTTRG
jgi:hypothetical protein